MAKTPFSGIEFRKFDTRRYSHGKRRFLSRRGAPPYNPLRIFLLALLALTHCSDSTREPAPGEEAVSALEQPVVQPQAASLSVPVGTDYKTVAVGASSQLTLSDRAQVLAATPGAFAPSTSTGSLVSAYGNSVKVGSITSLARVTIGTGSPAAVVSGSVVSGSTVSGAPQGVPVLQNQPLARSTLGWSVPFDVSTQNVTRSGGSTTLQPGSYGTVTMNGGTLVLLSGTYYIDGLLLQSSSSLVVNNSAQPTFVYVRSSLKYQTSLSAVASNLLIVYFGAAPVALEKTFTGTIIAPNATLRFAVGGTPHFGAVFAKTITLDPDVKFTHKSFSGWDLIPIGGGGSGGAGGGGVAAGANGGGNAGHGGVSSGGTAGTAGGGFTGTAGAAGSGGGGSFPPHCSNGSRDADETDTDCGGSCMGCEPGHGCNTESDCGTELTCGSFNGGCFGRARKDKVCWPAHCDGRILREQGDCGAADSPCGSNCACATACDADASQSTCGAGEVCKREVGTLLGLSSRDACVDPDHCPSNDPAFCGEGRTLCGPCLCNPDCSLATCRNPGDGCGGSCFSVCNMGDSGCRDDATCPVGATCLLEPDGIRRCRPKECLQEGLKPPLCGAPDALCGAECPRCTPDCSGRECGPDPKCGASCGSCGQGDHCAAAGQCTSAPADPPLTVPDGAGGDRALDPLSGPKGNPVGALRGGFNVSEGGTPEFTVPIDIPPGRAGVEPVISLRYSATRANGVAGVGWTIEGLSKITRCAKIFAVDGYGAPVKNDESDAFCLDGKRLVGVSGVYGANGAHYRTLIDSFARIRSFTGNQGVNLEPDSNPAVQRVPREKRGPDWFVVETKDGRILTYGLTADAVVIGLNAVRYSWLLRKVEDRAGNTIVFRYEPQRTAEGLSMPRPSVIAYTGHGELAGRREVRFAYESRNDIETRAFQGGIVARLSSRLSRISTYVGSEAVKSYRLNYVPGAASQIERIFECAGDGTGDEVTHCKPPTTFKYKQESGFTFSGGYDDLSAAVQLDVNGDGIADFWETQVNGEPISAHPELQAASIALDVGLAVAGMFATSGVGTAIVTFAGIVKGGIFGSLAARPHVDYKHRLHKGTGNRAAPMEILESVQGLPCYPGDNIFVLDYDRDGRDDLVGQCRKTTGASGNFSQLVLARSKGDGNFELMNQGIALISERRAPSRGESLGPILYDIDGDGLQDLLFCADEETLELRRRLGANADFDTPAEPVQINVAPPPDVSPPRGICTETQPTYWIQDIDGDGTNDLVFRSSEQWLVVRYSVVNGKAKLDLSPLAFEPWFQSEYGAGLGTGDFNGDGLVDFWKSLETKRNPFTVPLPPSSNDENAKYASIWINTGAGFARQQLSKPRPALGLLPPPVSYTRQAMVDYNADGITDILEAWRGKEQYLGAGTYYVPRANVALLSNRTASLLDPELASDIDRAVNGQRTGASFLKAADVDGDGNLDLFGEDWGMFYGSGSKNLVLERVVDGMGNFVSVDYDASGTYRRVTDDSTLPSCSRTWPELCLPRMTGLVSSTRHGILNANQGEVVERIDRYSYVNGRISVTGHGWLGFDRRTVHQSRSVGGGQTVMTDYAPPVRVRPSGAPADTNPPYVYPFAGFAREIWSDSRIGDTRPPFASLDQDVRRRTRILNTWEVGVSSASVVYPRLIKKETGVYEKPVQRIVIGDPSLDFDHGTLLTRCDEDFKVDPYGNTTYHDQRCGMPLDGVLVGDETTTKTTFEPNETAWLISNPKHSEVTSTRHNQTATRKLDFDYYINGLLHSVTRAADVDAAFHKTTFERNDFGNLVEVREEVKTGEPPRSTFIDAYDGDQTYPLRITNAKGHATELRFDRRFGAPIAVVDPNRIAMQSAYDAFGRVSETRGPQGVSVYTYAPAAAAQVETPVGRIYPRIEVAFERQGTQGTHIAGIKTELDAHGRAVRTFRRGIGGVELVAEQSFDAGGRLAGATRPHANATSPVPLDKFSYDNLDRVTRVDHSDGTFREQRRVSWAFLPADFAVFWFRNMTCFDDDQCPFEVELSTDEDGREDVAVSDRLGLPIRTLDGENLGAAEHYSSYSYGAFNRLVSTMQNGPDEGAPSGYYYDAYGRRLTSSDADTSVESRYNGYDELTYHADAAGKWRTFYYDLLGRLDTITDSSGITSYLYDSGENAIGRLSETISPPALSQGGQHVRYRYEPVTSSNRGLLQRVEYLIDGTSYPVTLEYDDLARPRRTQYPALGTGASVAVQQEYDVSGTPYALYRVDPTVPTLDSTAVPLWKLNGAYDGQLVSSETFANGAQTEYSYNAHRRWVDTTETRLGAVVQSIGYGHYASGRVEHRESLSSRWSYTYDALGRLSNTKETAPGGAQIGSTDYGYDHLGNLIQQGSRHAVVNQLRPHLFDRVGENSYHYDPSGNLDLRSGPDVPSGSQAFEYTSFDLPRQITTGANAVLFDYTADEERVVRRDTATGITSHFVADLYERVINANGSTAEERFKLFVAGRNLGEIVRKGGSEETLFFHLDHLGSIDTITRSTGPVVEQRFGDFGAVLGGSEMELTRAGFTGQSHDRDLGLVDMKGRLYDPLAARFTSADPLTQAPFWSQGLNRYSYVFNDPVNNTDPSGFLSINPGYPAGAVITGGVGAGAGLGALNVGLNLLNNPFQGTPGFSTHVSGVAHAAPTSNGPGPGSPQATGQNHGTVGPPSPELVQEGGTLGQDPHAPATCDGSGEPSCGNRRYGSSPMDQIVEQFLRAQSVAPEYPGTVADTILEPAAPEHVASIIQTANGGFRLGTLQASGIDTSRVFFDPPKLNPGERWVGLIHSHPGLRSGEILAQSRGYDLPTAQRLAGSPRSAFQSSYVVGPSGRGPHFGVIEFRPLPRPGALNTILVR